MDKFILDTNIFFNMQSGLDFGLKTKEILINLGKEIKKLKVKNKAFFYMPPKIVEEFTGFFKTKEEVGEADKFLSFINIKEPERDKVFLSSNIFYKLIKDIQKRSYLGLKIGEEEIINIAKTNMNFDRNSKKSFQIQIGGFIKKFRNRYKNATRHGFLDSVADLDLIILAKEIDGFLVSSDEGVVNWARFFGVKELPPKLLRKRVQSLL